MMTPTAIIKEAMADGVTLALSAAGTIKATGVEAADRFGPDPAGLCLCRSLVSTPFDIAGRAPR
ncbi:MAG: hypothetical protein ACREYF_11530 [Gammaproteobacteria bacterium]